MAVWFAHPVEANSFIVGFYKEACKVLSLPSATSASVRCMPCEAQKSIYIYLEIGLGVKSQVKSQNSGTDQRP